jgi:cyclopropane fatty-acyl-phospholipid synthase-like methyltransferase
VRLNLGSGSTPRVSGVVNVDIARLPEVDVVHDLDVLPWPWDDASVKAITAQDVFEHVGDPIGFMTESHRVLETGGELAIKSPHFRHQDAFTDPTHRRFCTLHTWDYWINGTELHKLHGAAYGGVTFGLMSRQVHSGAIYIRLHKI